MRNLILLAAGVLVTLTAQFGLDALADSTQLGHWVQHALLFGGGIAAGAALVQARLSAGRRLA